jgi:hypothetical protein
MEESQVELHSQGKVVRRRILQQISPLFLFLFPRAGLRYVARARSLPRSAVTWTVSVTAHNRGLFLFCITVEPVPGVEGGKPVIYSEAVQALRKLKQESHGKAGGFKILRLSEVSLN